MPLHTRPRRALLALPVAAVAAGLALGAGPAVGAVPPTSSAVTSSAVTAVRATVPGVVNRSDRAAVLSRYRSTVGPAIRVGVTWNGDVGRCDPGSASTETNDATLAAIDWARAQAGMPPVPGLNPGYTARAQSTALLMQASGALSHSPSSSWTCWTSEAAAGAARSNLALGVSGARAVLMYLSEPGAGNTDAGHRRWLLYPRLGQIGIGNTTKANAVYVIGSTTSLLAGVPAFYGWPTSGYFPRAAEPRGLWSLSSSRGASFASATVRVVGPTGARIPVIRYASHPGYGDNALVWRLATPPNRRAKADQTYRVTVSGIRTASGARTTYSYSVTLIS